MSVNVLPLAKIYLKCIANMCCKNIYFKIGTNIHFEYSSDIRAHRENKNKYMNIFFKFYKTIGVFILVHWRNIYTYIFLTYFGFFCISQFIN